jgi:hypothetical protein
LYEQGGTGKIDREKKNESSQLATRGISTGSGIECGPDNVVGVDDYDDDDDGGGGGGGPPRRMRGPR